MAVPAAGPDGLVQGVRPWRRWQAKARAGQPVKRGRGLHRRVISTGWSWSRWSASIPRGGIARSGPWSAMTGAWSRRQRCCRSWPAKTSCSARTTRNSAGSRPCNTRLLVQRHRPGPNQVWQVDFPEYETTGGGTWRVAGVADYVSTDEFGWHWSPTANQHDTIAGVELAPHKDRSHTQ